MQFDADAEEAERLLKTKYYHYEHVSGVSSIACDEYHIPEHLKEHVDYVTPGLKLLAGGKASSPAAKEKRGFRTNGSGKFSGPVLGEAITEALTNLNSSQSSMLANCDQYITPPCIMAMYNISRGTKAASGNQLGIFEEGDFYSQVDLTEFFLTFANYIPPLTHPKLDSVDGGFAPSVYAGGESDLDFQISVSPVLADSTYCTITDISCSQYPLIWPQNSILFQTDDIFYSSGLEGGGGFLNTFLDAIDGSYCTYCAYGECGDASIDPTYPDPNPLGYQGQLQCGVYKPTNVISISYGEQEDDLPTNYQQRQCSEFMKLGLQNVLQGMRQDDLC
jgi:tripeptidyl-peptidase-1